MPVHVEVSPAVLRWAIDRSRLPEDGLRAAFEALPDWERGESQPTLKQLESFARKTHTPFGFLLLEDPPEEPLPVPDFRVLPDSEIRRPSPDLLDTIYLCEQRQEWYRDFAILGGEPPLDFVGALTVDVDPARAATRIRADLGLHARGAMVSASGAAEGFRLVRDAAEEHGVLVMVSGVVGSDNHRILRVEEFRGFALADEYAPVVFVNAADTRAAQNFTLAHELAHIWLGRSALSDGRIDIAHDDDAERWCNAVAAELLVPAEDFKARYSPLVAWPEHLEELAGRYRVSTLVILRRAHDLGFVSRAAYLQAFPDEAARVRELATPRVSTGGDFYNTQPSRASRRFTRALLADTLEGRTLFTDAFHLLGVRKHETFMELCRRVGVD